MRLNVDYISILYTCIYIFIASMIWRYTYVTNQKNNNEKKVKMKQKKNNQQKIHEQTIT